VAEEIARLVDSGLTDRELEDARSYLLGREPFRRETARQWADILIEAEQYGLPLDDPYRRVADLRALDRATCEEVARRHLRPGDLRVTIGVPG
jgi:zinc protease